MPDDQPFPPHSLIAQNLAANRGGRAIFAGVSFALRSGDALAVTGANGAGKSTLLRLIAGLLRPAAGEVALLPAADGEEGGRIHYAGHLDALKSGLTVADNANFWARRWGRDELGADAALDRVGLAGLVNLPVAVLSAGQRRRAALARLLLAPRPLWLLDEPTASLDKAGEAMLGGMIGDHLRRGGIAIIATHAVLPIPPTQMLTLGAA
jgi:heme exporter protein A